MTDAAFKTMSVEEYLHSEESSPVRREYVHGFVYPLHAQAGGFDPHALISGATFSALRVLARQRGCFAYQSEMRVTTTDRQTYYYPDVMVTCEARDKRATFKVSPCILVEVLSRSTAHIDHGAKYHAYTSLPSLQTYLIVEQEKECVYAYQRTLDGWTMTEYSGNHEIPLPCLGSSITIAQVYEDMH